MHSNTAPRRRHDAELKAKVLADCDKAKPPTSVPVASGVVAVIRINAVWLAVEPVDMRAGIEALLARVVQVFGAAKSHHGYLFANAGGTRIKLLVHDGFGVWCAARRLNQGRFIWPRPGIAAPSALTRQQFDALVLGLPWQRLEQMSVITHL